jgi:hypothetical protein
MIIVQPPPLCKQWLADAFERIQRVLRDPNAPAAANRRNRADANRTPLMRTKVKAHANVKRRFSATRYLA